MAHRHGETSLPRAQNDRTWIGPALAAVPHGLVLAIMITEVLRSEGRDRSYAALIGVAEIYIVPAGLAAALLLRFSGRRRAWPAGVAISTLAGAAAVLIATVIVGNPATWS